jgi:tRNA 2-thiouridine synthesizing protein A
MAEPAELQADDEWDAGDLGCGTLVLQLRQRLRTMPGRVLKVTAYDAGAPQDLPAWCRRTDNELLRHDRDSRSYWIRSRTDWR